MSQTDTISVNALIEALQTVKRNGTSKKGKKGKKQSNQQQQNSRHCCPVTSVRCNRIIDFDMGQALKLRLVDFMTYKEIAEFMGVPQPLLYQRLRKVIGRTYSVRY